MAFTPSQSAVAARTPGRTWRFGAAAALALALAGCKATADHEITSSIATDYRQRHPIAIKEGDKTLDLFVGIGRGSLNATQRAQVLAFAGNWRREATGGIVIDAPVGTSNERAAQQAVKETRSLLLAAGATPRAIVVRPYRPADPAQLATVRLSYPKMVAEAGPCGLWPEDVGPSVNSGYFQNRHYWNFGCATQRNLAAMVANPADLVQPRAEAPPMAGRRSVVLEKYRSGESTATNYPNNGQGQISDVGQ